MQHTKTNLPEWLKQRQSHSAEVVKLTEQAPKIINDFENPNIEKETDTDALFMASPTTSSAAFKA